MALLETSREMRYQLEKDRELEQSTQEAKPFATRAKQLSELSDRIAPLRIQAEALKALGHPPDLPCDHAVALRQRLTDDRNALTEGGDTKNFRFGVQKSANKFCEEVTEGLATAWKQLVAATAPVGDLGFLRALRGQPSLKEAAGEALEHLEAIRSLSESVPADITKTHTRIAGLAEQYRRAAKALPLDDVPAAVRVFLEQARTQAGAPLDRFTPEIQEWLDEHNLARHFSVRAG